ncbi:hypothetical protein NIES4074_56430 [Cylindrospermum sp. NIES-4074]|nr:hypothetical protein NIES4074_56430 [Cylindrospermum sp. NIES-4074]
MHTNYCPCCSNLLLQHIRRSEIYWFCRSCRQEMPVFMGKNSSVLAGAILDKIPQQTHNKKHLSTRQSVTGWIAG